jgi:plastocyanin
MERAKPQLAALAASVLVVLALAAPAGATVQQVQAAGNVLTGGLGFFPGTLTLSVGDEVRWTNTDFLAPHTATEEHGMQGDALWDENGNERGTPISEPGFAPGDFRQRAFDAGTWNYYCRVHPQQMRGTISVPPTLAVQTLRGKRRDRRTGKRVVRYFVLATWSHAALPGNQVSQIQRRRGGGPWIVVRGGTRSLNGQFPGGRKGTVWSFRARVMRADKLSVATPWSPAATIRVG